MRPEMALRMVDLPAPFGPRRAVMLPSSTPNERFFTATKNRL
jgi:hypothetical protein